MNKSFCKRKIKLEYELIEVEGSSEKIIAKPRLTVLFGKEATIEIDNPTISEYSYLIKSTPVKSPQPNEEK